MEVRPRQIKHYETADGKDPFAEWMAGFRRDPIHGIITVRLERVARGNFGSCKSLKEGVFELIFDIGSGFRVYFGEDGDLVILLLGGTKNRQEADILEAKKYWRDYNA